MQCRSLTSNLRASSGRVSYTQRSRRRCLTTKAQGGPSNPIGIHAQVWVGDWSKNEAVKAISGTKKAGYDLIERRLCSACSDRLYLYLIYSSLSCYLGLLWPHQSGLPQSMPPNEVSILFRYELLKSWACLAFLCITHDNAIFLKLMGSWCGAVNVSVPETVDAKMTKSVLEEHDLGASASLVGPHEYF